MGLERKEHPMNSIDPEGSTLYSASPAPLGNTELGNTETTSTEAGWTGSVPPFPGSPEAERTPRSLRRGHRRRRAVGAAVILAAAVAGLGAGHVLVGGNATNTASTTGASLSLAQVEAKVDPGLVDVVTTLDYGEGEAAGTGIVLTSSGEILTNNHVVEGATSIEVTDIGNGKTYTATVLGYDVTSDVAVIKLQGASGLQTASLGDSSKVAVGESVVAIGNAGGAGGTPSAAPGTVTGLDQSITASDEATGSAEQLTKLLETDADIQPGDSGGPLVDASGQVVAMDTAASSTFQFQSVGSQDANGTEGYSIPINEALSLAKQIESGKSSSSVHIGTSAFLGVEVATTSAYYAYGTAASGATVVGIVPGSPADEAGLASGVTITSVGGHTVTSPTSLQDIMDKLHPGQKVTVSWVDQYGNSDKATVKLATGPTG
jgi:S1-C subfamily serine protease